MCIVYRMSMAESPIPEGFLHKRKYIGKRVLRELLQEAARQEVFIKLHHMFYIEGVKVAAVPVPPHHAKVQPTQPRWLHKVN